MAKVEAKQHVVEAGNADAEPRAPKRRRKAPAAGASEDCFTCRKRQTTCDRRRPYCGPCLDMGQACSGYRTVLTWGVGVASRGKLRGLSLPIVQSQAPTSAPAISKDRAFSIPAKSKGSPSAASSPGNPNKRARSSSIKSTGSVEARFAPMPPPPSGAPLPLPQPPPQVQLQAHRSVEPSLPAPQHNYYGKWQEVTTNWAAPPPYAQQQSDHGSHDELHRLHTNLHFPYDDSPTSPSTTGSLMSTVSLGAYSDASYDFYRDQIPTPDAIPFTDPFVKQVSSSDPRNGHLHTSSHVGTATLYMNEVKREPNAVPPEYHPYSHSSLDITQSKLDAALSMAELRGIHSELGSDAFVIKSENDLAYSHSSPADRSTTAINEEDDVEETIISQSLMPTLQKPSFMNPFPQLSPRIRGLLDFYDKQICPVLVTTDGASNPYRMHVMHLAVRNEGLQYAIGALVTNNLRMRALKDIPQLKNEVDPALSDDNRRNSTTIEPPSAEEQHYKAKSIEHLNRQLASPIYARDDSVLGTLLILCLFHVCDSGFSKFKTQLAGVQKLLKMRGRSARTDFVGWVEMFFAWFDVMSSSVNDRECEIQGESLDFIDTSAHSGALEDFSGCDGRLFKLISRLGRLNLLSQGRPVKDMDTLRPNLKRSFTDSSSSQLDYYSLDREQQEDNPAQGPAALSKSVGGDAAPEYPDERRAFWKEWHDIRHQLEEWQIYGHIPASGPEKEILHISESFRYSALIYTERLAYPQLTSSSDNIQRLVMHSIYHIGSIEANSCVVKFMLWPLFITGTECVDEAHRDLIRSRCMEIQLESGFYNNLSGLKVLEKVWREPDNGTESSCSGQQAFRWRKAMDRADGEYIVI